jgi:ElaB/YqjD/DUF883 family membrane-anchored ribosome-binding protein
MTPYQEAFLRGYEKKAAMHPFHQMNADASKTHPLHHRIAEHLKNIHHHASEALKKHMATAGEKFHQLGEQIQHHTGNASQAVQHQFHNIGEKLQHHGGQALSHIKAHPKAYGAGAAGAIAGGAGLAALVHHLHSQGHSDEHIKQMLSEQE